MGGLGGGLSAGDVGGVGMWGVGVVGVYSIERIPESIVMKSVGLCACLRA